MVPDELSKKMRACSQKTDKVYLKLAHDLGPGGRARPDMVGAVGSRSEKWEAPI